MRPLTIKDIRNGKTSVNAKKRIVNGYFATINSVDRDRDTIHRNAFDFTFKEWGPQGRDVIRFLNDHKSFEPLGRPLELGVDDYGAWHETYVPKTRAGDEALELMGSGVMTWQSFKYAVMDYEILPEFKSVPEVRQLKELKVYEYSLLSDPADWDTGISEIKSATAIGDEILKRIDSSLNSLKNGQLKDTELKHFMEIEMIDIYKMLEQKNNSETKVSLKNNSSITGDNIADNDLSKNGYFEEITSELKSFANVLNEVKTQGELRQTEVSLDNLLKEIKLGSI